MDEKQIKQMQKYLCACYGGYGGYEQCGFCYGEKDGYVGCIGLAERLYEAGFRKVNSPCNIGDKVYQVASCRDYVVCESTIKNIVYETDVVAFDERAIGNSIFLTKEEAEAHIRKLTGGKEY